MILYHCNNGRYSLPYQIIVLDYLRANPQGVPQDQDLDKVLLNFIGKKYQSAINLADKRNLQEWGAVKRDILYPSIDEEESSSEESGYD